MAQNCDEMAQENTVSARSGMAQSEAFRREAALQCLLVFLECAGDREDKVKAAVEYATLLTYELKRTEAP